MNNIHIADTYLNNQKALAERLHNELHMENVKLYSRLAGLVVGTVVATYVAIKIQNS